jgi:hypothetical protein
MRNIIREWFSVERKTRENTALLVKAANAISRDKNTDNAVELIQRYHNK